MPFGTQSFLLWIKVMPGIPLALSLRLWRRGLLASTARRRGISKSPAAGGKSFLGGRGTSSAQKRSREEETAGETMADSLGGEILQMRRTGRASSVYLRGHDRVDAEVRRPALADVAGRRKCARSPRPSMQYTLDLPVNVVLRQNEQ